MKYKVEGRALVRIFKGEALKLPIIKNLRYRLAVSEPKLHFNVSRETLKCVRGIQINLYASYKGFQIRKWV